jgi:hypothetical protein
LPCHLFPNRRTYTVDEALKLNIEDKEESSPRRPSTKRARHTEEQPAGASAAPPADPAPEGGAGRPKRKAAPAPATETPVRSRGKKVKTDTAASAAAAAPVSKAKKGAEKKVVSSGDDEAAKEQQEADEVDALADEPAENGATASGQGAFFPFPSFVSLCPQVFRVLMSCSGLQKFPIRLGQMIRQAVSSLKVPRSKPSLFKPPRRPYALWGPVPEQRESVLHCFLFIRSCQVCKTLSLVTVLLYVSSAYRLVLTP